MEKKKIDLKPGEVCPYCGQRRRRKKSMTDKQITANKENLAKRKSKGGRPKKSN